MRLQPDFKPCAVCGVAFFPSPSATPATWAKRRHCSRGCENRSRAADPRETERYVTRLSRKTDRTSGLGPGGDCWEWRGRIDGKGYGEMKAIIYLSERKMEPVAITREMISAASLALVESGMLDRGGEQLAEALAETVLVEALDAAGLRRKTSLEMELSRL